MQNLFLEESQRGEKTMIARIGRFIKKLPLETKEENWIGIWGFKYLFCKKPLWINFLPIPIRIMKEEKCIASCYCKDAISQ